MMLAQKSQIGYRTRVGWLVNNLLILLFLGVGSPSLALAIKPQPPLQLTLSHSSLQHGTIEVVFEAVANISVESVVLSFHLAESLALVEGEKEWTGSIPSGEKKTLKVFVQTVSSLPGKVIGEATVHLPEGGSFVQQSTIILNPEEKEGPPPRPPPIRWKRGNETILEFRGK